jgi:hypothetical protein
VGREINYRNPHGSHPAPAAKEIPKTLWYTQPGMPVPWAGFDGTIDTATWRTPIFDLRPDLRSAQNMAKSGVPVWDTRARLYIQVFGLTTADNTTEFLRLGYSEFANTTFGQVTSPQPARAVAPQGGGFPPQTGRDPVVRVTAIIDLTSELMMGTNQPNSVVLVFEPLGEGYPIRYWQVQLTWVNLGVAGPALNLQAAMY